MIIYGFVTSDNPSAESILDKQFEIKFDIYVRGKNSETESWTTHTPRAEVTLKAVCNKDDHLCTYFPAGFIPFIKYEMYDVAIVVHPTETLDSLAATSIDFHIAYFNEEFTQEQLIMRTVFSTLSALFLVVFAGKTLCRIKNEDQGRLPFETMSALTLLFLLFVFNDPFYPVHLYDPNFITFAVSEF